MTAAARSSLSSRPFHMWCPTPGMYCVRRMAGSASRTAVARMGRQLANPLAVGLRNAAIRLTPPGAMIRTVLRHADWTPPRIAPRAARTGAPDPA
ncbi:hypothetical protein [Streptomyces sp. CBMA156]|uniref:hypothetical protein n=1 Tax=Streptomyces sp. CBMA156 TaxID=1930280 RepID=UPI001661D438|nr:hypothetical protein [Streptomyces sp. CBMA156]